MKRLKRSPWRSAEGPSALVAEKATVGSAHGRTSQSVSVSDQAGQTGHWHQNIQKRDSRENIYIYLFIYIIYIFIYLFIYVCVQARMNKIRWPRDLETDLDVDVLFILAFVVLY